MFKILFLSKKQKIALYETIEKQLEKLKNIMREYPLASKDAFDKWYDEYRLLGDIAEKLNKKGRK